MHPHNAGDGANKRQVLSGVIESEPTGKAQVECIDTGKSTARDNLGSDAIRGE